MNEAERDLAAEAPKRKRGRPRTREKPPEDAPPKKRGRKPKPKEEKEKKAKRKFEKRVWKATDFSLPNRNQALEREVVLEVPINPEEIDKATDQLQLGKDKTVSASFDRSIATNSTIRFQVSERNSERGIDDLVREREEQDDETLEQFKDKHDFPAAQSEKRPADAIIPPPYNPEVDIGDDELIMISGFNDDIDSEDDESAGGGDAFKTDIIRVRNPVPESPQDREDRADRADTVFTHAPQPVAKTSMPDHIPFSKSLVNTGIVFKEVYAVLPELYDFTNGRDLSWPERTNIHCWWDTHPFEGVPIPYPKDYSRNLKKFFVRGCFCSFNCALAYLQSVNPRRTSLLNYFYFLWTGKRDPIKAAPPRETLRIFGGVLTIEQFRRNFTEMTRIELMIPPIVPETEKIEFSLVRPLIDNKKQSMLRQNNLESVAEMLPQTRLQRKVPVAQQRTSIVTQFGDAAFKT